MGLLRSGVGRGLCAGVGRRRGGRGPGGQQHDLSFVVRDRPLHLHLLGRTPSVTLSSRRPVPALVRGRGLGRAAQGGRCSHGVGCCRRCCARSYRGRVADDGRFAFVRSAAARLDLDGSNGRGCGGGAAADGALSGSWCCAAAALHAYVPRARCCLLTPSTYPLASIYPRRTLDALFWRVVPRTRLARCRVGSTPYTISPLGLNLSRRALQRRAFGRSSTRWRALLRL